VVPGNGLSVSVWFDSWTTLGPLADALPAAFSHCLAPAATLSDAVGAGPLSVPTRHRVTPHAEAELSYLRAQLGALHLSPALDCWVVTLGSSEEFRAVDVYRTLHSSGCVVPFNDVNWVNFAPPRVRVFFWIMRLGRTRTRTHLFRLGCEPSPHCPFCPGVREDHEHLFVRCPRLEPLWALSADGLRLSPDADIFDLLHGLAARLPRLHPLALHSGVLALLWSVWKTRNRMVFDGDLLPASRIAALAVEHLRLWVVRAPRRIDLAPLLSWCDRVV
jgi:hypothetical protein